MPSADSHAMKDLARSGEFPADWKDDPVDFVHSSAQMRVIAAEDFLLAMIRSAVAPPVSVFGGKVLLRACLEHSAIACRLMDPQVDTKRRIARAYTELLYSFAQWKELPDGNAILNWPQ